MYLIAIAWLYVVLMMAVAEATNANGTVVGAVFTFLGYGVLPLSLVLYIGGAPARRRLRRAAEAREGTAREAAPTAPTGQTAEASDAAEASEGSQTAAAAPVEPVAPAADRDAGTSAAQPGRSGHAAGDAVAPERKEP